MSARLKMFDPDYDLFLAIVEASSISAAARQRGLSTPALSKRLARLEARLGARLLHRTTRRLTLTPAGKELFEALMPVRAALGEIENRVEGRHGAARGPLRVTAPTSFGRTHVIPLVPGFIEAHPQVELHINLSDEFEDLMSGRHDVAIRITPKVPPDLVGHRLGTNKRVLCAAPSYLRANDEPRTLADLGAHRLLATDSQLPWRLQGPEGQVVHNGQSAVRTNSSEVVRELAIRGCGIALRSLWDVSNALAAGSLRLILERYAGSEEVGIYAVHTPEPPMRVLTFITHLQRHMAPF